MLFLLVVHPGGDAQSQRACIYTGATKARHGGIARLRNAMNEDRLLLNNDAQDDQEDDADDGEQSATWRAALSRARQAHLAVADVVELAIGVVTGRRAVWVLHTNASWPRRVDLAVPLSSQRSSRKR